LILGTSVGGECGAATTGDVERPDREGVKNDVNFEEVLENEEDRPWGTPAVPDGWAVVVVVLLVRDWTVLDALFRTIFILSLDIPQVRKMSSRSWEG
jgi:hypothetical protein